ncbi:hypothetical protein HaLaN_31350, partial [Haematococcus lacustris]
MWMFKSCNTQERDKRLARHKRNAGRGSACLVLAYCRTCVLQDRSTTQHQHHNDQDDVLHPYSVQLNSPHGLLNEPSKHEILPVVREFKYSATTAFAATHMRAGGHPRHWPRNSLFDTVFDQLHVILSPLGSTSHHGAASRRGGLVAGGISVPSSLCCRWTGQLANTSQASTGRCVLLRVAHDAKTCSQTCLPPQVLGCFEEQHQTHISPRLSQAAVQPGYQPWKTVSWRMPVNHPHLNNRAARDEPNARRCAVCGFTTAAKNKNAFVMVERVGEDACHGRYQVVFGHASVLKGCV